MNKIIKITFVGLMALWASGIAAQENLGSYRNAYVGLNYDIVLQPNEGEGKFALYIYAMSLDKEHDEGGGLIVEDDAYAGFVDNLRAAKEKYSEWVAVAQQNNVTELDRAMTRQDTVHAFFKYGGQSYLSLNVPLQYNFRIMDNGGQPRYLLIVRTDELTAQSDPSVKVKDFVLVFTSGEDFDAFLDKISPDKIKAATSKLNLFTE